MLLYVVVYYRMLLYVVVCCCMLLYVVVSHSSRSLTLLCPLPSYPYNPLVTDGGILYWQVALSSLLNETTAQGPGLASKTGLGMRFLAKEETKSHWEAAERIVADLIASSQIAQSNRTALPSQMVNDQVTLLCTVTKTLHAMLQPSQSSSSALSPLPRQALSTTPALALPPSSHPPPPTPLSLGELKRQIELVGVMVDLRVPTLLMDCLDIHINNHISHHQQLHITAAAVLHRLLCLITITAEHLTQGYCYRTDARASSSTRTGASAGASSNATGVRAGSAVGGLGMGLGVVMPLRQILAGASSTAGSAVAVSNGGGGHVTTTPTTPTNHHNHNDDDNGDNHGDDHGDIVMMTRTLSSHHYHLQQTLLSALTTHRAQSNSSVKSDRAQSSSPVKSDRAQSNGFTSLLLLACRRLVMLTSSSSATSGYGVDDMDIIIVTDLCHDLLSILLHCTTPSTAVAHRAQSNSPVKSDRAQSNLPVKSVLTAVCQDRTLMDVLMTIVKLPLVMSSSSSSSSSSSTLASIQTMILVLMSQWLSSGNGNSCNGSGGGSNTGTNGIGSGNDVSPITTTTICVQAALTCLGHQVSSTPTSTSTLTPSHSSATASATARDVDVDYWCVERSIACCRCLLIAWQQSPPSSSSSSSSSSLLSSRQVIVHALMTTPPPNQTSQLNRTSPSQNSQSNLTAPMKALLNLLSHTNLDHHSHQYHPLHPHFSHYHHHSHRLDKGMLDDVMQLLCLLTTQANSISPTNRDKDDSSAGYGGARDVTPTSSSSSSSSSWLALLSQPLFESVSRQLHTGGMGEISPRGVVYALQLLTAIAAARGGGGGGRGEGGLSTNMGQGQESDQSNHPTPTTNHHPTVSDKDHVRMILQLAHREGLAGLLALVCLPQHLLLCRQWAARMRTRARAGASVRTETRARARFDYENYSQDGGDVDMDGLGGLYDGVSGGGEEEEGVVVSDLLMAVCGLLRCVLNHISSPWSDNIPTTTNNSQSNSNSNSNSQSNSNNTEPADTSGVGIGGGGGESGPTVSYSQKVLEGIYRTQLIGCLVQALPPPPQSQSQSQQQQQQLQTSPLLLTTKAAAAVVQVLSSYSYSTS